MNTAIIFLLFAAVVALVVAAVVVSLRDDQRWWTVGIAVGTLLFAPVGVVLAIVYFTVFRRRLGIA